MSFPVQINAQLRPSEDGLDGAARYEFDLYNSNGDKISLIVDVPEVLTETTDVWVLNHTVMIGDTPADGFATYIPKEN